VAVAADGSVYVAGATVGTFPGQTSAGSVDAFVRKYDAAGAEVWTRQFGTTSGDQARGVAVAADGSVSVAGVSGNDTFVRKYDAAGAGVWTRQFDLASSVQAWGVAAAGGSVYVAGDTTGTLPGQTSAGGQDAFVVKLDGSAAPADATPPSITPTVSGTLGSNGWFVSNVTVSWTVTDPETSFTSTGCGASTVTSDTAGTTFTCTATSAGGTASQSVTVKRDATPPTITGSRTPEPNANGWNNTDVTVSFACTDALSLVSACSEPTIVGTEGADQNRNGVATDQAGNSASATVSGINIDKTAPTITGSRTPVANANGWNNTDVTVSFACSDALSGLAAGACPGPTTLTSEGANQSVSGSVTDLAGNTASATVGDINIDKTAPTITGSRTPEANANGWNNTDVTVSFACADTLSGLAAGACPVPTTLTGEGANQSVSGSVMDKAGNTASVTVGGINIDKTPPFTFGFQTPLANANGWNNTNVIVRFNASDALSGLATVRTVIVSMSLEGAGQSVTRMATDRAGNSASATVSGINIDKTAPTITGSRTPVANANGWNNTDVTVSFACSDALSGLAAGACPGPTTLTSEGANQSVSGSVTDLAGNTASATVGGINIDKTAPVVTPPANVTVLATGPSGATVTYPPATATDNIAVVSGPSCIPASGSTFPLGATLVTCSASDAAGNIGTATFTITVLSPAQAMQQLTDFIPGLGLPKNTETSLTAPLIQTVNLLTDNNPNNDGAACGQLGAFLQQVAAKQTNGQLTLAQAAQLTAAANAIRTSLGC
jgi:hypothetical protein